MSASHPHSDDWDKKLVSEETLLLPVGQLLSLLWERKYIILGCILGVLFLTVLYVSVATPTYKATAVLLVDPRTPKVTDASEVLSSYGQDSAAIASQVEVLGSSNILQKVIANQNIINDPEYNKGGLLSIFRKSTPNENAILEAFRKNLEIVRQGTTYVIDVSYTSNDPNKAARIANAVVEAYLSEQKSQKSQVNSDVNDQLDGRIKILRESVSKAEAAVASYMATNGIVETGTGSTLFQAQIEQINTQLLAAQNAASTAKNALALAEQNAKLNLEAATSSLDTVSSARLRTNLDALEAQKSRLSTALGAAHPQMQALDMEISRVRSLLRAEVERDISQKRAEAQRRQQDAEALKQELARARDRVDLSNKQKVELDQLKRQAAAARGVLEQFQRRSEEVSQLDGLQQPYANVITPATAPSTPSWPKPKLLIPVMGAFGVFLGVAVALLVNSGSYLSSAFRSAGSRSVQPSTVANASAPLPVLPRKPHNPEPVELGTLHLEPLDRQVDSRLEQANVLRRLLSSIDAERSPQIVAVSAYENYLSGVDVIKILAEQLFSLDAAVIVIDLEGRRGLAHTRLAGEEAWSRDNIVTSVPELARADMSSSPAWVSLRSPGHAGEVRNEVLAARSMLANISDFVLVLSRDFEKLKEIGDLSAIRITILAEAAPIPLEILEYPDVRKNGIIRAVSSKSLLEMLKEPARQERNVPRAASRHAR